jgi:hypothetical protein
MTLISSRFVFSKEKNKIGRFLHMKNILLIICISFASLTAYGQAVVRESDSKMQNSVNLLLGITIKL